MEQDEFPKLFERIKVLFPEESMDNYYTQGTDNSFPGGSLFNSFRYYHSVLQKETGICRRKRSKKGCKGMRREIVSDLTEEGNENLRKELIGRMEPWDSIKEDWVKTYSYRRNEIEDKQIDCATIVSRWPKMKKKRGHELVSKN